MVTHLRTLEDAGDTTAMFLVMRLVSTLHLGTGVHLCILELNLIRMDWSNTCEATHVFRLPNFIKSVPVFSIMMVPTPLQLLPICPLQHLTQRRRTLVCTAVLRWHLLMQPSIRSMRLLFSFSWVLIKHTGPNSMLSHTVPVYKATLSRTITCKTLSMKMQLRGVN